MPAQQSLEVTHRRAAAPKLPFLDLAAQDEARDRARGAGVQGVSKPTTREADEAGRKVQQ